MLEHARNTEITDFNLAWLRHEDVLSFQISVQDLPIMDMLDGKGHLDEPVQDLILTVADYYTKIENVSDKF